MSVLMHWCSVSQSGSRKFPSLAALRQDWWCTTTDTLLHSWCYFWTEHNGASLTVHLNSHIMNATGQSAQCRHDCVDATLIALWRACQDKWFFSLSAMCAFLVCINTVIHWVNHRMQNTLHNQPHVRSKEETSIKSDCGESWKMQLYFALWIANCNITVRCKWPRFSLNLSPVRLLHWKRHYWWICPDLMRILRILSVRMS